MSPINRRSLVRILLVSAIGLGPATAAAHPEPEHPPQAEPSPSSIETTEGPIEPTIEPVDETSEPVEDTVEPDETIVDADGASLEYGISVTSVEVAPAEREASFDPEGSSATEILGQTGADAVQWEPPLHERFMSPVGVNDPFPDQPRRARPRDAGVLLGLGASFAIASVITARMTLLPDCEDQSDLSSCVAPAPAELGLRTGRLVGTLGFSIGAAAFGAFGARELGQRLQQGTRWSLERRRRAAVGLGVSTMAMGLTTATVGSVVLGLGARRGLRIASTLETAPADDPQTWVSVQAAVDQVKVARVGLMVLVASPVLIATGTALLVHRPRDEPRRLSLAPTVSPTQLGLTATLRF
ncbi:MAG: hypothetical protein KC501_33110 [Myxococcales bacterium]|nr:hypothetical protein [Myxococcales bacterium]